MKELSIEEKAKAYDEALERAMELQEKSNGMILKKWLWKVFPELQENVKPKFKVDDWVINRFGNVWHIDSFDNKNYQVSDGKGNYNYFPITKQDEMHLWTIKDAKPGDILVDEDIDVNGLFHGSGCP